MDILTTETEKLLSELSRMESGPILCMLLKMLLQDVRRTRRVIIQLQAKVTELYHHLFQLQQKVDIRSVASGRKTVSCQSSLSQNLAESQHIRCIHSDVIKKCWQGAKNCRFWARYFKNDREY